MHTDVYKYTIKVNKHVHFQAEEFNELKNISFGKLKFSADDIS